MRDGLLQQSQLMERRNAPNPLDGFRILDVGCGGGILSEVRIKKESIND